jgi:hypothetical protein
MAIAAEGCPAQVGIAKERATRSVVSPDLILVAERRRRLLGDDHWSHPGSRVVRCRRFHIVRARDGDGFKALERRRAGEVRGEVRVVESRTVRPGEMTTGIRAGAEGERWVAVGDQSALKILGQGPDRPDMRGTGSRTQTISGRPATISWLCPACAAIEGEVDARGANSRSERTGGWVTGITRLKVDFIIRTGY